MEAAHIRKTPKLIRDTFDLYLKGYPTGHFLRCVLEDDLVGAISRADEGNLRCIKYIVMYMYNEMPSECWGSKELVDAWLEKKQKEREDTNAADTGH